MKNFVTWKIFIFSILVALGLGFAMLNKNTFRSFEKKTTKHFRQSSFAKKANGEISFDLDWGTVGMTGKLTGGRFGNQDMWASDFVESINWNASQDLLNLYENSKAHPNGPIYRCIIRLEKGRPKFRYFLEGTPIYSLSDISKDNNDLYPLFAYRTYFTEELIEASDQGFLLIGHKELISTLLLDGKNVPEYHMEFYALNDFISDFYNGGSNQYFNRTVTWDAAQYDRIKLYPRLREALKKLDREDVRRLFDEAIALYAHYNEHIEEARKKLNIPAIPKQEESDISSRFSEIIDDVERDAENYIKTNKAKFAYH